MQINSKAQTFADGLVALSRAWEESHRQLAAAFEIALTKYPPAVEPHERTAPEPTETETTMAIVNNAIRNYVLKRAESHPDTCVDLRATITQLQVIAAVTDALVGDQAEPETAADIADIFNAEAFADADRKRVIANALGPFIDSTIAQTRAEYLDQMVTAVPPALVTHGAYR